jgi:hypothetical protein
MHKLAGNSNSYFTSNLPYYYEFTVLLRIYRITTNLSYYYEFTVLLRILDSSLSHFSKLKIRVRLKFEELLFTL